jgi:EmrB/QacA subfamily drug resistance transporter
MERKLLTTLLLGVFLGALDIAVLGPALPAIRAEFGVDQRSLAWLLNAYVLANLVGSPLLAMLSDRLGRRKVYLACVSLFALGSLWAILSPSWEQLIAARVVQGFGAGGIFPIASATIGEVIAPERRGRAMGMIGAMFGIAFLVGPIVGGLCLMLSWHWIFLLNLPISALVLWQASLHIPTAAKPDRKPFDILGMVLLAVALLGLSSSFNLVDTHAVLDSLTSAPVLPLVLGTILASGLFFWVETRVQDPIIHPHLLKISGIRVSMALGLAIGLVQVAGTTFFPSFAIAAFDVAPKDASFMLIPLVLGITIGSPTVGRILDRTGPRPLVIVGVGVLIACFGVLALMPPTLPVFYVASALLGLFMSTLQGPVRYACLNAAPPTERAAAQSLVTMNTAIGSIAAAAAMGAVTAGNPGLPGFSQAYLATAGGLGLAFVVAFFLPTKITSTVAAEKALLDS